MASQEIKRADVRAYIGATGTGKGVSIIKHLQSQRPTRLVVFDPLQEYGALARPVTTVREAIEAMKGKTFKVAWQPPDETDYKAKKFKADFELLCRAAFIAGDLTLLVEELELVTSPTWAPAAWRNCTKRGRHVGLRIIGASQRPADCDKAFLSSCTYVRAFALREHKDRQRVAQALDVPIEQILKLKTLNHGNKTTITLYEKNYSEGTEGEKTIVLQR